MSQGDTMGNDENAKLGEEIARITDRIHEDASGWSYPSDEDLERLWEIASILQGTYDPTPQGEEMVTDPYDSPSYKGMDK
jgi:hypothetical protein